MFDTGLLDDETYFANPVVRTDWTGENVTADSVGHGTFVAGLIAGNHPACPGLAPAVHLHLFRVFTGAQMSYTSWFLDAFNYAMHVGVDVLNLSVGGPDFADLPFTEKVDELAANGIVVVSAIGNDGPLWGSLNNPGDMMDVVGVGGVDANGEVASFSSRGMTMHEVGGGGGGYGRVKPDLVAYARGLVAPSHKAVEKCRKLSGTSVASPVVAGAIALLMSAIPKERRRKVVNPASVKLVLMRSSRRLRRAAMYEQGGGLLDIEDAYNELMNLDAQFMRAIEQVERRQRVQQQGQEERFEGPTAGFFPAFYDLTREGCPYMWPHCAQPIYPGALPVMLNVTVLNPGGAEGRLENVTWVGGKNAKYLKVMVTPPRRFWPWAAGMGIHLSAVAGAGGLKQERLVANGVLKVRVASIHKGWYSDIELPIRADIVHTPPKEKRLLWDIYHSIRYPPGYVPRDSLVEQKDILDWLGDHPHTNFHELYRHLLQAGFHVEILDFPLTCLKPEMASKYGGVLLVDSEDYFTPNESRLLEWLVREQGVTLVVAAEWYNADVMHSLLFEDDNTRSWWSPIAAGGNAPALNEILRAFDIAFGEAVLSGNIKTRQGAFRFESGVPIVQFPRLGELLYVSGLRLHSTTHTRAEQESLFSQIQVPDMPLLGLAKAGRGAVLVYGDTNCIDTAYSGERCYDFFTGAVEHAVTKCAAVKSCEKMLTESIVLKEYLIPDLEGLRRLARRPSQNDLELLTPHSKTLMTREGVVRNWDSFIHQMGGERPSCALEIEQGETPSIASFRDSEFIIPHHRIAEPVGAESRYFQSLRSGLPHPLIDGQARSDVNVNGTSLPKGILRAHYYISANSRPVVAIFIGTFFILLSLLIKFHRSYMRQVRRNARLARNRTRCSISPSPSVLSDCDSCVSASFGISGFFGIPSREFENWKRRVETP